LWLLYFVVMGLLRSLLVVMPTVTAACLQTFGQGKFLPDHQCALKQTA
jgi:hypothetical protein